MADSPPRALQPSTDAQEWPHTTSGHQRHACSDSASPAAQQPRYRRETNTAPSARRSGARRRRVQNERPRQAPAGRSAARADARAAPHTPTRIDRVVGPFIAMARTAARRTDVVVFEHFERTIRARTIRRCRAERAQHHSADAHQDRRARRQLRPQAFRPEVQQGPRRAQPTQDHRYPQQRLDCSRQARKCLRPDAAQRDHFDHLASGTPDRGRRGG